MLDSIEAEMKYPPQSRRMYNSRIGNSELQSTGPSTSPSGSWLGNLWRRLNRPDPNLPPDFVVRSTSRQGKEKENGKGKVPRIQNQAKDWNRSTVATPSVPLEFAVRPARATQRIIPQPTVAGKASASRSIRMQAATEGSAPLEPPEFALRPTRVPKSNIGGKSSMEQRNGSPRSPLSESPELSARGNPSKSRDSPDMKPPYYARW
jgi:hypothetical protein